jgi:hypothetical protein
VVAVTPKRVTITAMDPDEKGEGLVTRHVSPDKLQPQVALPKPPAPAVAHSKRPPKKAPVTADSFEGRYPNITSWVRDGWIEIGHDDCGRSFLRALDIGGMAWEGDGPFTSMDEALQALDAGIAEWIRENS